MDIESLRKYCLSFPHVTENVQWGYDLVFKVDGKMFAVTPLEVAPVSLSFKCSPENFAELCEREGVRPAPYMARAQWVALDKLNTLPDTELRELLAESYRLVWERLTNKRRAELEKAGPTRTERLPLVARVFGQAKPSRSRRKRAAQSRGSADEGGARPSVTACGLLLVRRDGCCRARSFSGSSSATAGKAGAEKSKSQRTSAGTTGARFLCRAACR